MSFDEIVADALNVRFDTDIFGKAATYTPPGGGPAVTCNVTAGREDRELGGFNAKPITEGILIDVRRAEVATPAKGGTFVIGAETFEIVGSPRTNDAERLIWSCVVRKTAP